MSDFKRDTCESCRKPIIRAETDTGRPIRVNAEPERSGNLALDDRGRSQPPLARTVAPHLAFGRINLHTRHSCTHTRRQP